MFKRLYHWIRWSRSKGCRHCCLFCAYWEWCKDDGGAVITEGGDVDADKR